MKQIRHNWIALAAVALAFPISALADLSDTKTLTATQSLNLSTGATTTSGGDLLWNGTSLTPQGAAKAAILPGVSFAAINQIVIQGVLAALGSSAAIQSSSLTTGTVIGVLTNASLPAKVMVTAISGSSITLQFTTYGAAAGSGGPTISRVTNNSSDIFPGLPNSGISQGALFKVVGSGLADDGDANLHDSQPGLPTTLNGAKITVTVGSTTVNVALYYATPTQIDGVLPANTPIGSGTLTVTHNGTANATIQIVAAAPGITTYSNGTAVAQDTARPTDPYGGLITFTKSAAPGAIIVIWGSGFGATSDDDVKYTGNPHQTSVSYTLYVGGVQANVAYAGRSVYPGVSVFVVTIPQNAPTGCYVPIAAVTGNIVSNIATLPIHAGGGVCSDPQYGITGDQISTFTGQTTFKSGGVSVSQSTTPGVGGAPETVTAAGASFFQVSGASITGGSQVSIGGCIVIQTAPGQTGGVTGSTTGLDAGTVTVAPPGSAPITLTTNPIVPGIAFATLSAIPSTGGSYVFNGSGGAQVGKFTATVNFANPLLTWTNQSAATTVTRSQGLQVTWSGGAGGTYVTIFGTSFNVSSSTSGTYICLAPAAAGQFTVPSYVLLSLPSGTGTASVANSTIPTPFSVSGVDFANATGSISVSVSSTYN
ncbi:MAG: hypothetical protein JWO19_2092 [Bryobacterales bacterium]|nr:hypothetical protein [Bryobacterales bacterium]